MRFFNKLVKIDPEKVYQYFLLIKIIALTIQMCRTNPKIVTPNISR